MVSNDPLILYSTGLFGRVRKREEGTVQTFPEVPKGKAEGGFVVGWS
jgi:hypothetical protein